ncbi:glycosyltransferase [candidate division WOR-3 bacterium]|nr:glycosyltransferase [candidate division WOR-3 bacterium]
MKILFLPKQIPHSKVIGGPIIIYNRIKELSKRHEVSLLSFLREDSEKQWLSTVTKYCKEAEFLPLPHWYGRIAICPYSLFQFFFSPTPPYFLTTYTQEMENKVAKMTRKYKYDVIIAEYSVMGQYLYKNKRLPNVRKVISCHECYFTARYNTFKQNWYKKEGLTALTHLKRLKHYEFNMYRSADKVLTLTPQDKATLLSFAPDLNISVVPHGVDVTYFTPSDHSSLEPSVMFLGNYPHLPNRDAVLYFYNDILPLIRKEFTELKFYIVGRNPQSEINDLVKRDSGIIVTGTVSDVREYFKKTKIFICPIRLGGGFRGKILEAMASGVPVVSTSLGAYGIPAKDGENILIADSKIDFANKVIKLLQDKELYKRIAKNGRKLVEQEFSWAKGAEKLEKVLLSIF